MAILIWPLYFLSLIIVMTSQRLPKKLVKINPLERKIEKGVIFGT